MEKLRKFKFRAWDKDCEEMFYSDKEYDDHFFELKDDQLFCFSIIEDGFVGTIYEPPSPSCEPLDNLMEYTGLKDQSGKEIYEGDIVKIARVKYNIEFRDGGFELISIGKGFAAVARLCRDYRNIEIIGNIYEGEVNDGKTD